MLNENMIVRKLEKLNTTYSFLAALDGQISAEVLRQSLRGNRSLPNADFLRLNELLGKLETINDLLSPVVIDWSNAQVAREILKTFDDFDLHRAIRAKLLTHFEGGLAALEKERPESIQV